MNSSWWLIFAISWTPSQILNNFWSTSCIRIELAAPSRASNGLQTADKSYDYEQDLELRRAGGKGWLPQWIASAAKLPKLSPGKKFINLPMFCRKPFKNHLSSPSCSAAFNSSTACCSRLLFHPETMAWHSSSKYGTSSSHAWSELTQTSAPLSGLIFILLPNLFLIGSKLSDAASTALGWNLISTFPGWVSFIYNET